MAAAERVVPRPAASDGTTGSFSVQITSLSAGRRDAGDAVGDHAGRRTRIGRAGLRAAGAARPAPGRASSGCRRAGRSCRRRGSCAPPGRAAVGGSAGEVGLGADGGERPPVDLGAVADVVVGGGHAPVRRRSNPEPSGRPRSVTATGAAGGAALVAAGDVDRADEPRSGGQAPLRSDPPLGLGQRVGLGLPAPGRADARHHPRRRIGGVDEQPEPEASCSSTAASSRPSAGDRRDGERAPRRDPQDGCRTAGGQRRASTAGTDPAEAGAAEAGASGRRAVMRTRAAAPASDRRPGRLPVGRRPRPCRQRERPQPAADRRARRSRRPPARRRPSARQPSARATTASTASAVGDRLLAEPGDPQPARAVGAARATELGPARLRWCRRHRRRG